MRWTKQRKKAVKDASAKCKNFSKTISTQKTKMQKDTSMKLIREFPIAGAPKLKT